LNKNSSHFTIFLVCLKIIKLLATQNILEEREETDHSSKQEIDPRKCPMLVTAFFIKESMRSELSSPHHPSKGKSSTKISCGTA
jgi:hypothetical protein